MKQYIPANCHVQKAKPKEQCEHKERARHLLPNGRRVCGVHLRMHDQGKELVFMQDPGVQTDMVVGDVPEPIDIGHTVSNVTAAEIIAGKAGLRRATEVLAEIEASGPIVSAYINKEDHVSKKLTIAGSGSSSIMGEKEVMKELFTWLVDRLTKGTDKGYTIDGISGAAPGFDYVWARAILEVDLPLTIALPSPDYLDYYWGLVSDGTHLLRRINKPGNRKWIDGVIEKATTVVHVCDSYIVDGRAGKANFVRNEWMVDNCDWLWLYNPKTPGTRHAYSYASKVQRKTLEVPIIKSKSVA